MNLSLPQLSSQAFYWAFQRKDGSGIALTSHDQKGSVAGVIHHAAPGFVPESIVLSDKMLGSSMKLDISLSSSALRASDLTAGRWAGSSVSVSAADWSLDAGASVLCSGVLTAVQVSAGSLIAEVDLVPSVMREQPCPQTSPECRATLGDRQCRVDMRTRTARMRIVGVDGEWLQVDHDDLEPFRMGHIRWLSGPNAGLDHMILETSVSAFRLREQPSHSISIGDGILAREGCDGRLQTCFERFQNAANFRGEPHLPGTDLLTRYPGD